LFFAGIGNETEKSTCFFERKVNRCHLSQSAIQLKSWTRKIETKIVIRVREFNSLKILVL